MNITTSAWSQALYKKRWWIAVFLLLAMLASCATILLVAHYAHENMARANLNQAIALANSLPANDINELTGDSAQKDSPLHQKTNATLLKVRKATQKARSIYIMRKRGDDYIFVAESEPEGNPIATDYGEVYMSTSDEFKTGYAKQVAFLEGPITDKWGHWMSIHAPIFTDNGQMVGVIGIDLDVDLWQNQLLLFRVVAGMMLVLVLLISLAAWAFFIAMRQAQRLERQSHFQANFDELTGAPNRFYALSHLEKWIHRASDENKKFTLLYFDLDGLKRINDTHGHLAGDEYIKCFAQRVKAVLDTHSRAFFGRIGGDEFIALINPIGTPSKAKQLIGTIDQALAKPIKQGKLQGRYIRASIGYALFPEHGTGSDEILHHADLRMYQAKKAS